MISLSSNISNYTWAIISFICATGILYLGINVYIKTKKILSTRMKTLRICGLFSVSIAFYSISIANYLLYVGYDKLSIYFMILGAIFIVVLIGISIVVKVISKKEEITVINKRF